MTALLPVLNRRALFALLLAAPAAARSYASAEDGWISLFNGRSLDGWKAGERAESFSVAEGCIVASGGRSHLYYTGPAHQADFKKNRKADQHPHEDHGYRQPAWAKSMHQPLANGCRATRVRQQMAQYRSKPQHQRHMPQQIADASRN